MYGQKYRIIHYDLKPANIIFHYGCVKILDFGLCKRMDSEDTKIDLTSQGVGTYWYLPPETFMNDAEVSPKVDVWSLGVIFYELLFGKRPFGHGVNQIKIYQDGIILKAQKVEFPTDKKFKVSEEAKEFIRACLKYDPNDRLDPEQVYNHVYLNKFKIE
jgi:tousled-like kinase